MAKEEEPAAPAEPAQKKGSLGLILGIAIGALLLVGGTVAAVLLLVPGLSGGSATAAESAEGNEGETAAEDGAKAEDAESDEAKKKKPEDAEKAEPLNILSAEIPAVIVDLRDEEENIRHLRVGLAAELPDDVTLEDFKLVIPRAREAALGYVRSLTFEEASDPKNYASIKEELASRVTAAVGASRVHRVLLVDFVAQ